MPVNSLSAPSITPSQRSVHAELLEARWYPISREDDSHIEHHEVNHSAPIEAYDSTSGVCNELARIALNRSAVMQAYDSMFPRTEALRATARRRSPPREATGRSLVQRALDFLRGRTPRRADPDRS